MRLKPDFSLNETLMHLNLAANPVKKAGPSLVNIFLHKVYLACLLFFGTFWLIFNSSSDFGLHVYPWLLVIFLLGSSFLVAEYFLTRRCFFSSKSLVIILFLYFFVMRSLIDLETARAKELIIGTTGGILLFYLLGVFFGFIFNALTKLHPNESDTRLNFVYVSMSALIFISYAVFVLSSGSSTEIAKLFISADGSYQRKGSLLVLLYIVYSLLFLSVRNRNSFWKYTNLIFFITNTLILLFYAQFVRSNSGFASIILILLSMTYLEFVTIKGKKMVRFITASYFLIAILVPILVIINPLDRMDISYYLSHLRIIGYGKFEFSSITSRIDLLTYMPDQMQYGLIFGDLNSDLKSGNQGKYPHNLLFNSLTHLGIFGFALMLTILFSLLVRNGLFSVSRATGGYRSGEWSKKFHFVHTLPVILIALFFQTITWAPFWFILGVYVPVFKLRRNLNE